MPIRRSGWTPAVRIPHRPSSPNQADRTVLTRVSTTEPPPTAEADPVAARRWHRGGRIVRARLGLAGSAFAVLFFCASLTPSLLPRAWYLQGIVSGLTAAIGYGAGAALG